MVESVVMKEVCRPLLRCNGGTDSRWRCSQDMLHMASDVLYACHRGAGVKGEGVFVVRSVPFSCAGAAKEGASWTRRTGGGSMQHEHVRKPFIVSSGVRLQLFSLFVCRREDVVIMALRGVVEWPAKGSSK